MQMGKLYGCFLAFDNFGYFSSRILYGNCHSLFIRATKNPFAHFAKINYYVLINYTIYYYNYHYITQRYFDE